MRKALAWSAVGIVTLAAIAAWSRDQGAIHEEQRGLLAQATVLPHAARQKALEVAGGGSITEAEIEEENGRLIYSFEVKGPDGVTEVEIDARTGEVLQSDQEDDDEDDDDEKDEDKR